jgi:hypothetical protein
MTMAAGGGAWGRTEVPTDHRIKDFELALARSTRVVSGADQPSQLPLSSMVRSLLRTYPTRITKPALSIEDERTLEDMADRYGALVNAYNDSAQAILDAYCAVMEDSDDQGAIAFLEQIELLSAQYWEGIYFDLINTLSSGGRVSLDRYLAEVIAPGRVIVTTDLHVLSQEYPKVVSAIARSACNDRHKSDPVPSSAPSSGMLAPSEGGVEQ